MRSCDAKQRRACKLLTRRTQRLATNWRQKSTAHSRLKLAVEDVLDTGLPRACDKPVCERNCSALFEQN